MELKYIGEEEPAARLAQYHGQKEAQHQQRLEKVQADEAALLAMCLMQKSSGRSTDQVCRPRVRSSSSPLRGSLDEPSSAQPVLVSALRGMSTLFVCAAPPPSFDVARNPNQARRLSRRRWLRAKLGASRTSRAQSMQSLASWSCRARLPQAPRPMRRGVTSSARTRCRPGSPHNSPTPCSRRCLPCP